MKTGTIIAIIVAVIIIAVAYWWIFLKSNVYVKEGDACIINGFPGNIKNGVCVRNHVILPNHTPQTG